MPVRIYDISKKLGLENKEVLSKAKELGIAAARVASSSLDKITAEYLEQQILLARPELAARSAPAPAPPEPPPVATPPEILPAQALQATVQISTAVLEAPAPLPEAPIPVPAVKETA